MDIGVIKLCGAAVIAAVGAFILKGSKSSIGNSMSIALFLLVFSFCLGVLEPIVTELSSLAAGFGAEEYFLPIIKALGVAFVVQMASSICADLGESRIGEGIELAGKFEILLLSLPMIKSIVGYALELISLE